VQSYNIIEIFIGEEARWQGQPLATAMVQLVHDLKIGKIYRKLLAKNLLRKNNPGHRWLNNSLNSVNLQVTSRGSSGKRFSVRQDQTVMYWRDLRGWIR